MSDRKLIFILLITGLLSYFIGAGIFFLITDGTNDITMLLFMITFGLLNLSLLYLYFKKKHPKVITDMKLEQNDEREKMIKEKASYYTLNFTFISIFAAIIVFIATESTILSFVLSVIFVILVMLYILLTYYLKNKI